MIPSAIFKFGPILHQRNWCCFSTFVSKHFTVDPVEFKRLLDTMGTEVRLASNSEDDIELKVCKLCMKGNKTKGDNLWKLRIRKNGSFYCFRCALSGNWFDLKQRALGFMNNARSVLSTGRGVSCNSPYYGNQVIGENLGSLTYEKLTYLFDLQK